jgi:hypothetical protein
LCSFFERFSRFERASYLGNSQVSRLPKPLSSSTPAASTTSAAQYDLAAILDQRPVRVCGIGSISMQPMMLRFGIGLSREATVSIRRWLSQYASSAEQPNEEQHDRDDQEHMDERPNGVNPEEPQ